MAEDKDQQTEEATPKKIAKLHEEGNAPKSSDINTVAVLIAVAGSLAAIGADLAGEVVGVSGRMFRLEDRDQPFQALARVAAVLPILSVPIFAAMLAAFAAGWSQTRTFTFKPLIPKPDKLNPIPNFKKLLPGKDTLIELSKQVVKLAAVGGTVYSVIVDTAPRFSILPMAELPVAAIAVASALGNLAVKAILAFAVVSIFDYLLARRKFNEDAKMSKQEVKDERKQEDISPEVRAQIRRRQMEMKGFIPGAVKDATVVVTNPTHFAVALRYEAEKDAAPMVLCKGVDDVAAEMRSEARRHDVPIVENRPLARALYAEAKVGEPIPLQFYRAVAEVVAFVMQLRQQRYGVLPGGGA